MASTNLAVKGASAAGTDGHSAPSVRGGVVILDEGFRAIALDPGAKAIIDSLIGKANGKPRELPEPILNCIRLRRAEYGGMTPLYLTAGGFDYSCRTFVVRLPAGGDALFALYFRREALLLDVVRQVAADYHLTDREREAVMGLLAGLTGRQLAGQMGISRNTVKAFVRLAMTKMGVNNRAHLFAKVLDTRSG